MNAAIIAVVLFICLSALVAGESTTVQLPRHATASTDTIDLQYGFLRNGSVLILNLTFLSTNDSALSWSSASTATRRRPLFISLCTMPNGRRQTSVEAMSMDDAVAGADTVVVVPPTRPSELNFTVGGGATNPACVLDAYWTDVAHPTTPTSSATNTSTRITQTTTTTSTSVTTTATTTTTTTTSVGNGTADPTEIPQVNASNTLRVGFRSGRTWSVWQSYIYFGRDSDDYGSGAALVSAETNGSATLATGGSATLAKSFPTSPARTSIVLYLSAFAADSNISVTLGLLWQPNASNATCETAAEWVPQASTTTSTFLIPFLVIVPNDAAAVNATSSGCINGPPSPAAQYVCERCFTGYFGGDCRFDSQAAAVSATQTTTPNPYVMLVALYTLQVVDVEATGNTLDQNVFLTFLARGLASRQFTVTLDRFAVVSVEFNKSDASWTVKFFFTAATVPTDPTPDELRARVAPAVSQLPSRYNGSQLVSVDTTFEVNKFTTRHASTNERPNEDVPVWAFVLAAMLVAAAVILVVVGISIGVYCAMKKCTTTTTTTTTTNTTRDEVSTAVCIEGSQNQSQVERPYVEAEVQGTVEALPPVAGSSSSVDPA